MDEVKRAIFAALMNAAAEIVIGTKVVYVCGKRFHHPKNRLLILS